MGRLDQVEAALRPLDAVEAVDAERGGSSGDAGEGDDEECDKRRARRVSTTDAAVRVMKMAPKTRPGGGGRPAVDVRSATDVESGVVVGVGVTKPGQRPAATGGDGGSDRRTLRHRSRRMARRWRLRLAGYGDGPRRPRHRALRPAARAARRPPARPATSEWVDTQTRSRGFQQMPVRGLVEAKAIALWHAIGHNLTHLIAPLAARPA